MRSGLYLCMAVAPWTEDVARDLKVVHPAAREVGEQRDGWPSGDLVTMLCPYCGHRWEKELPQ
jgi:hypothetical protein